MSFATKCQDSSSGPLVSFYRGEGTDGVGRTLEQVQSWGNDRLEYTHDYIQWLFPLKTRSNFNPAAPVLDESQIRAFRRDTRLRTKLVKSLRVMLSFYGFECEDAKGAVLIRTSPNYSSRKQAWLNRGNHNFLRITRILTSLRLLGLEDYAQAFFSCLYQIFLKEPDNIGRITYEYWRDAGGHL